MEVSARRVKGEGRALCSEGEGGLPKSISSLRMEAQGRNGLWPPPMHFSSSLRGELCFHFIPLRFFQLYPVAFSYLPRICFRTKVSSLSFKKGQWEWIAVLADREGRRQGSIWLEPRGTEEMKRSSIKLSVIGLLLCRHELGRPPLSSELQGIKSLKVIEEKLNARPRKRPDWPKVTEWFHNRLTKKWLLCFEILVLFP